MFEDRHLGFFGLQGSIAWLPDNTSCLNPRLQVDAAAEPDTTETNLLLPALRCDTGTNTIKRRNKWEALTGFKPRLK